ncbi:MAG: hypothetical protein WBH04_09560 [Albidovulum sp.]
MSSTCICEIVTFKTNAGISPDETVARARGLQGFLATCPAFISRSLSQDDDGIWTDYILWRSLPEAKSAGEAVMRAPEAAPFMAAIAPDSVKMRYHPVLLHQIA